MKKKVRLKRSSKILFVSLILLLAFSVTTIVFFINNNKNNQKNSLTYTEKSAINYKVCLKSNNYFDQTCLGSNQSYVADIIDYINIDFSYLITASNPLTSNYSYDITAEVIATSKENSSNVIYDKKTIIMENQTYKNQKGTSVDITKPLKINYSNYSNIITNFKKDYILALDAKLILTMNVKYNGQYNEHFDNISSNKSLVLEIPLSEQTVTIKNKTSNKAISKTIYQNKASDKKTNLVLYSLISIDIIILLVVILSIYNLKPSKKEYLLELEKILKEYDRAIVTANKIPELGDRDIIEVSSFEELLDARDNLEKPILFYQSTKEDKSIFTIMNENDAYVYILKAKYKEK